MGKARLRRCDQNATSTPQGGRARWCEPGMTFGYVQAPITGKCSGKVRDSATRGKRTTGLEPATFGLGSRRSTN